MRMRRVGYQKFVWLFVITGMVIAGLLLYRQATDEQTTMVETVMIAREDVQEVTVCVGTVSAADGVKVYAPLPCIAGTVMVKVGDTVKKGDVLIEIDRDATVSQAVSVGLIDSQMGSMVSSLVTSSVIAPADGVVSVINAEQGGLISTSAPCVVLSENTDIEIAVTMKESALPKVKIGQPVTVSGVAFDKKAYRGTLTYISPTARTRLNGTSTETVVDAVVTLCDGEADDSLLIGLSAKASITVDTQKDVLQVPYECLMQDDNGNTAVYVVQGDRAIRTTITVGKESASGVEVLDGVTEGASLVKDPEQLTGDVVRVTAKAEG